MLAALPVAALAGARLSRPVLAALVGSAALAGAGPLLLATGRGSWTGALGAVGLLAAAAVGGDLVRGRAEARTRQAVVHAYETGLVAPGRG